MAVLKINNVSLTPDPYDLTVAIQDLDYETGAGRSQTGKMFRDRVAVKRKVSCKWRPMGKSEMSGLLSKMTDEFFSLTYPDPLTGKNETITAYVGDRTSPMYTMHDGVWLWNGLEANFIER